MRKRYNGTGSVYQSPSTGEWWARVVLADGRRVGRRRGSEEAAIAAVEAMIELHAAELGYGYRAVRESGPRHPELRREHPPRSGVTPRVRFAVLTRDGFRCVYCGAEAADVKLVVDHVLPVADGGSDAIENLATACFLCNAGKADRSLPNRP